MKRKEPGLIYHSLHGRGYRGCLPVTFVLSALVVAGIVSVLNVNMPKSIRAKGVGQLYYRNDRLIHAQIRQRSPLPMSVPLYVDPARQETAIAVEADGRVEPERLPAPPFNFLATPPDFAVLDESSLLALPPEQNDGSPSEETAPTTPSGEEVAP